MSLSTENAIILVNVDECTPMSMMDDVLRVDWYNADEGYCGDYDPDDPDDVNLLRFDVYVRNGVDASGRSIWEPVEDASYCTEMPADAPKEILEEGLRYIFSNYRDVIQGYPYPSVKKLGEGLSWVSDTSFPI